MAAMLTAGVPLQRTLTSMEEQTAPGPIRTALRSMARHVLAGGAFSDAMKQFPYIFSELQVEFIGCAEQTGGMGAMMSRLADYLDQDHELREMVRKETFHAKITAVAAALLPNVVVLFLSGPEAYVDQTLKPLGVLALCVAGLYVAFRYAMQSSTFRYIFDTFKSYIPYFGQTVRLLSISKFSRALAALYNAGVQLPTGMEISARVSGNQYLSTLIMRAVAAVKSGMGLSEAFRISGVFPPMFVSMLRTGEETGKVDEMLHKVADYYEADGKVRLHQSVQALTTMIFMAVAIWVALIVIRFFMGYASQLQGAM
jgi:type II secretory pathway component PulF